MAMKMGDERPLASTLLQGCWDWIGGRGTYLQWHVYDTMNGMYSVNQNTTSTIPSPTSPLEQPAPVSVRKGPTSDLVLDILTTGNCTEKTQY